jgi:hypothetical protein
VSVVVSVLHSLRFLIRSRAALLHLEIVALRHQRAVARLDGLHHHYMLEPVAA